LFVGVKRHAAPAGDTKRDLAGIILQHAAAQRRPVGIEDVDLRIAGNAKEKFIGVTVEREICLAGRIGAGIDIAHALLAQSRAHLILRLRSAAEQETQQESGPKSGHCVH
jgi:hypothetical protein